MVCPRAQSETLVAAKSGYGGENDDRPAAALAPINADDKVSRGRLRVLAQDRDESSPDAATTRAVKDIAARRLL